MAEDPTFARFRLAQLRRRLRGSLTADVGVAAGWPTWLDRATSPTDLRSAEEPAWLVHLAFWSGASSRALFHTALRFAAAERAGRQPSPIQDAEWDRLEAALDPRANQFDDRSLLLALFARLERAITTSPAGEALARELNLEVTLVDALGLEAARARLELGDAPIDSNLAATQRASHPSTLAFFALLAIAAGHCEANRREPTAFAISRAFSCAARARPDHRPMMVAAIAPVFDAADLPTAHVEKPRR